MRMMVNHSLYTCARNRINAEPARGRLVRERARSRSVRAALSCLETRECRILLRYALGLGSRAAITYITVPTGKTVSLVARRVKPQLRVGDADDEGAAAGLLDGAQARECRGDRRRLARASEGVRASEGSEGVRVVAVRVRVRVRSRARARARVGRHAWSSPLRKMAHGGHVRHAGPVQELAPLLAPDGHEGLGHDDQHPACLRSRRAWRGVGRGGEGGGSRESRLEVGAKCELG
jgi:hypothetical protein